jgi:hypothetical protein
LLLSVKRFVQPWRRVSHPGDHQAKPRLVQWFTGARCSRSGDLADTWADRHSGSLQGSFGRTRPPEYRAERPSRGLISSWLEARNGVLVIGNDLSRPSGASRRRRAIQQEVIPLSSKDAVSMPLPAV